MSTDQRILEALAEARNAGEVEGDLYEFYERLVRAIVEQKTSLALSVEQLLRAGEATALARAGEPHLLFDRLGIDAGAFFAWMQQVATLFETRDPGVWDELEGWGAEEIVALARLWYEEGSAWQGATVDAVVGNALAPYLEHAADALIPHIPLHIWRERYCPVCGGFPDFALWTEEQDTGLSCERCRAMWEAPVVGCLFCGETDPEARGFYSTEDDLYRVEVCDTCGYYLKGMNREALPPHFMPLPAAERLLTPALDLLAIQEGYLRPVGVAGHIEE